MPGKMMPVSSRSPRILSVIYLSRIFIFYLWCGGIVAVISGQTMLVQHDIRLTGNTTWTLARSPYRVQQTVVVPKGAVLIIEPGVRLEFLPGCGLIVQGALLALGESQRRILMTSAQAPVLPPVGAPDVTRQANFNDDLLNFHREIRLVRGWDPAHGQIQLLHRSKWRSVCTHSYNWTAEDIRVACVQMGYAEGLFDAWVQHINDTDYMLLTKPKCSGLETSLAQCADFNSARVSHDICEGHPDMLIRCMRHSPAIQRRHWMGIQFSNASYTTQFPHGRTLQVNVTASILQHVDIFYAGSGADGQLTSAIEAIGAPPIVRNCTIQFSAFNGLNFTHTTGAAQILDSKFRWNKGHGMSVNSTEGNVTLHNVASEFNAADGIHYVHNDTFLQLPDTFCTRPQLGLSQSYPIYVSGNQYVRNYSTRGADCPQKFYVQEPYILTVHFLLLEATDATSGYLEVRDGSDYTSKLLSTVRIANGTRPESIATNGNRLYIHFRTLPRHYARFVIKITAGLVKDVDLNITNSQFTGNGGRGIAIHNMRSGLNMERTVVRENQYLAGIHVESGVGDVNVSFSVITRNQGDGINITYVGGRRNITISKITENQKRGIAIGFNETTPRTSFQQETHIADSFIEQNWLGGILYGNFCLDNSLLNVTNTSFAGNQGTGIEIWSCLTPPVNSRGILTFVMEWNKFLDSNSVALKIRPAGFLTAHIGNNSFLGHKRGVIWIQNMDFPFHDEWNQLPADIAIAENVFTGNSGPFVVLMGLSETSTNQKLHFRYNQLRDNVVIPATNHVRRHRSEGVVIVGSSNVFVNWNSLDNPRSPIWLATHSRNPARIINATANWWGTIEERVIYDRVFGGKDRYDLSHVTFRPYLSRADLMDSEAIAPPPEYRKPFVNGNVVGGLYGERGGSLSGDYRVHADMIIQPNSVLTIRAGTKLLFDAGVGVLSQGKIVIEGSLAFPVLFDMSEPQEPVGFTNESSIRLVNGPSQFEGRLELLLDGEWGTVCNDRWTVKDAGVVCRQMGLAHAPEDFLEGLVHYGPGTGNIIRSHVKCDDWDWDLLKCPHDSLFEHSCSHLQDAGVKCRPPGWAGMRLPITADQSIIEHAIFRRAGILDFDSQSVSSALQIDFNIMHRIRNCVFEDNANAGLVILYNHLMSGSNSVQGARFRQNAGSGLVTYSPGLTVVDGEFIQNGRSAFTYDPKITRYQQREFISFLQRKNSWRNTHQISVTEKQTTIQVESNQELLIVSSNKPHMLNSSVTINVILKDLAYVFGVQVLNPPQRLSTETIKIFNGDQKAADVEVWLLDERVNSVPATSVSYKMVLEYYSGSSPQGNVIILLSPMLRRENNPSRQLITSLENCKFDKNKRAIEIVHYDLLDQHDSPYEFPRRFNNESIRIVNTQILNSVDEGLKVVNYQPLINVNRSYENADYYLLKSLSRVSYYLNGSIFHQNGAGIIQSRQGFMNVDASGNIYQWTIANSSITASSGPSLHFDFPISLGKRNYAMWDKRYMRAELLRLEYENSEQKFWDLALDRIMYDVFDQRWMEREHLRRLGYQAFHASTENLPSSAVHSLQIFNNKILANRNTYIKIDGDFLRLNFTGNEVSGNQCPSHLGLMRLSGTEKELKIENNFFQENQCIFVVEFDISSHTASTGRVPASFMGNDIRKNRGGTTSISGVPDTNPGSYAVAVKGLQRINVTFNLFENPGMEYEFISGLLTDRLDMELEVRFNWWGTANASVIRQKLFDFDDWNCYAHAQFLPFLGTSQITAVPSSYDPPVASISAEFLGVLGGRLTASVILTKRANPYVVNRDLTILPGVTLTIESGVRMEFLPNVGILVLGNLKAVGMETDPVIFAPVTRTSVQRMMRPVIMAQIKPVSDIGNVRLFGGRIRREGYLEVLNMTTNQWVPIWHADFSARDAAVVCRHLGHPTNDVQIWRGPRVEDFRFVRTWMRPFYCIGTETRIHDCELPLTEMRIPIKNQIENMFVYIHCVDRHIPPQTEYWGGIRFARPGIEFQDAGSSVDESVLQDVSIYGAGMLHGKKASAAVEIIHRNPRMERVKVLQSASSGITVINPTGNLVLHHTHVENSVLVGVNILLLHGDLQADPLKTSFDPIKHRLDPGMGSLPPLTAQFINGISLGANVFGLVDICSADKVVHVRKRVLILFRYDSPSLRKDCVKIFQVGGMRNFNRMPDAPAVKIGFRLLEWNLHNSEYLPNMDFIELFEGNVYNQTDYRFLARLNATDNIRQTFESSKETLTVHLSTTVAPNPLTYGFIAEIVTLPPAYVGIDREAKLNLTSSTIQGNRRGGLQIYTTGELNPIIAIERCVFQANGEKIFHNFSTSYHAAYLDVQNSPQIEIHNNNFKANQGGLHIVANSMTDATRMKANIRSNLFHANRGSSALFILGRSVSPYQEAIVQRNIFFDNTGQFADNIILGKIVGNFSQNQVLYNVGRYNLLLDGFGHVSLNDYQTVHRSNFIKNLAFGRPELNLIDFRAKDKTTVFATGSGQSLTDNVLNNPDNDLDLHVTNQTELFPVDIGIVDAKLNYWGSPYEAGVAGRIREKSDDRWLHQVSFKPFHASNSSLMDGKCYPGFTLIRDSCYLYVGGVTTFQEADLFCKLINASLPYADKLEYLLTRFIHEQQRNFDWRLDGVWVHSDVTPVDKCIYMRNQRIWPNNDNCGSPRAFLCERDTAFVVTSKSWHTQVVYIAAIIVAIIAFVLVLCLACCWMKKSKQRQKEAFRRRDSIRESIRISRTSLAFASTMNLNGGLYPQQLNLSKTNLCQVTDFPTGPRGDSSSMTKSSGTFNSSVEFSPDYDFFEARNDAVILEHYYNQGKISLKSHLTPSDLTFHNIAFIDSSNSRTSTRTDTMSLDTTVDVKPDFTTTYPEDDEDSPRSFRYYENVVPSMRQSQLLETDM